MFSHRIILTGLTAGFLAAVSPVALATAAPRVKATPASERPLRPKAPLTILVSLDQQRLTLYEGLVPIAETTVSSGVIGHETPTGVFSILQKNRDHKSNIYSDAPMPYMQRITWSGIALHEGRVTGAPASHGCIRLPKAFAMQLWRMTKLNVRVIVTHQDVSLAEIEAPSFFKLLPRADTNVVIATDAPAPVVFLQGDAPRSDISPVASVRATDNLRPSMMPTEPAHEEAVVDGDTGLATQEAAPLDLALAAPAPTSPKDVVIDLYPEEAAKPAQGKPVQAQAAPQVPTAPQMQVTASLDAGSFDLMLPKDFRDKRPPTFDRKAGPLSVFISKKDGKLYVRQDFKQVFETAVTFDDQEQAIGTHVLTAVEGTTEGMRWASTTVPSAISVQRDRDIAARKQRQAAGASTPVRVAANGPLTWWHMSGPSEALRRVHVPEEIGDAIAKALTPGSSLIISDLGASIETGKGTDFILLAK
ncbi:MULTISPECIES: L,D-transpeptidase [unclassified Beijerinckia]|uniref:L,D-transpeptidase n=1 Tax=unclassified Beijerinckia TaxID=2638183 RepID=UPI000896592C|nr:MULTISPECIES: L,D-transpeptidase [unclassified Beijerinckia]MDH7799352.1 hypothetical protein [Beijerinckia sp. GAS462]SED47281.1 L,D-transpeptidase catalytic domain [Beijerinckia sp. 28-YEA-48]